MEDKQRNHIIKNTEDLIRLTNYDALVNECVRQQLITPKMRQIIEDVPTSSQDDYGKDPKHEQHRRLFLKITKRGPKAYGILKELLIILKCDKAVMLLNKQRYEDEDDQSLNALTYEKRKVIRAEEEKDENTSWNATYHDVDDETPKLLEYVGEINPSLKRTVIKSQQIHENLKVGTYTMKSQDQRGVFFMVNIIDFPNPEERRNGAEEDGEAMLHLFKQLGFKLFAYRNLTQKQFFYLLDELIKSQYTRETECFVLALMSHGNMHDTMLEIVQFHDGSIAKVSDIKERFDNRNCQHLLHKPKILIFPFCRGGRPDHGVYKPVQTDSIGLRIKRNVPTTSDMLICYASDSGFETHRDADKGAWYIQKFYELMAQHAHDTDFDDIVKMIQRETGKLRAPTGSLQTGSYINIGFDRKLFFNPGVWEQIPSN